MGTGTTAPNLMHQASLIGVRARGADLAIKNVRAEKIDLPRDMAEAKFSDPRRGANCISTIRGLGKWCPGKDSNLHGR
jgi:hypothetical protein